MKLSLSDSILGDYLQVLVRRRWVVYLSILATTLIAVVGSFLATPQYRATVTLQIERQNPDVLTFRDISQLDTSWSAYADFYQTQYRIIASPAVAVRAVRTLGLDSHPDFQPSDSKPSLLSRLKAMLPRRTSPVPMDPVDVAAASVISRLEVAPIRNSHLVLVSQVDPDPELAAKIANAIADAYIEHTIDTMFSTTRNAQDFLIDQIVELRQEIQTDEEALQDYGELKGIVSIDDTTNVTMQALRDISARLTKAHSVRAEAEANYLAMIETEADALPDVRNSTLITRLRAEYASYESAYIEKSQRFKPDWPEMQVLKSRLESAGDRLEIEVEKIAEQVRANAKAEYQRALGEEREFQELLDEQYSEAQLLRRDSVEYAYLLSEAQKKRETLNRLIKRQNEVSLAARITDIDATSTNIRIQDTARPPAGPFQPNTRLNVLLGLVFGCLLGVGMAHILDYLDNTVKSSADLQKISDCPILATIPHHGKAVEASEKATRKTVEVKTGPGFDLVTHWDSRAGVSEAYRELRTALLLSHAGQPPLQIVVTSGMPREGKSATTMNLAAVLAQLGRRVLVIDTDLRRPRLHGAMNLTNNRGVSTYLSGLENDAKELVQNTDVAGLFAIPSGPIPPNPSELLNSPRFAQMGRELLDHGFDHIIYDSPPVLSVSDAVIISTIVDSAILVVRAYQTPRNSVTVALERLKTAGHGTTGLVLNDIEHGGPGRYYYRYYGERPEASDDRTAPAGKQAGGAA